jgi:hypothetical protein
MDHFYQTVPGFFNFHGIYREMVQLCPSGGTIVELGSYLGASTAFLCVEALNSDRPIRIVAVDTWADGLYYEGRPIYAEFLRHLEPAIRTGCLHHLRSASAEAACHFANRSVHSVFIDADHRYAGVLADIRAWWPKFAGVSTGVFAGHDFDVRTPGVGQAVHEFFDPLGIELNSVPPTANEDSLLAVPMKDVASWRVVSE